MGLLRMLFALSVVSAHTQPILGTSLIGGKMAVQSFFLFSGFYMALILDKKYTGKHAYKLFITNRILRLYPTYFIVLLLVVIFSFVFMLHGQHNAFYLYSQYHQQIPLLIFLYLIIVNLIIVGMDLVMFMGINIHDKTFFFTNNYLSTNPLLYNFLLIPQAWTLSLEFVFYLLAPFLVKKKLKVILLIIFASLALRIYLYTLGLHREPWTNRFFPTELIFFLGGIVSYRMYQKIKAKNVLNLGKFLFFFIVLLTVFYNFFSPLQSYIGDISQLIYFLLLFISIPFIFALTKQNWIDQKFGLLSYPIYISHLFVLQILQTFVNMSSQYVGLEVSIATIIFSIFLVRFVENPINRYRQQRLKYKSSKS